MEPNVRLIDSMEAVFDDSEARVVIAFEVLKEREGGARYWKGGAAKKARSPRVLCVTVKRSKDRGYNGTLFVCKATPSTRPFYQIRSQWEMGKIVSIELPKPTEGSPFAIELNFERESRNYVFHAEEQRICFVAVILEICRLHEDVRPPPVVGIPEESIRTWWNENSAKVLAVLGEFVQGLFTTVTHAEDEAADPNSASDALVSQKEDRDLNALLELFAMGPGDVQDFETRLQDEHRALEDANVYAMMESSRAVDGIMGKLRSASHLLDDMDQSLLVFDVKLRHMKDDIAAIEARNNTLEMEARNSAKLLTTLQNLLSRLELRKNYENILEKGTFESDRLSGLIEAATALHGTLTQMDPSSIDGIPSTLVRMRAVRDQKFKLELLGKGFTKRANEYLTLKFRQKTDQVLKHMPTVTSPVTMPKLEISVSDISQWREQHAPLLKAMYFLQKDSLESMGQNYCATMNSIFKRRLNAYLSRLRTTAKMSLSQASHDLDISKPTSEGRFAALELMVTKAKESVTGSYISDKESSVHYSQKSKGKTGSALDSGGSPTVTSSKMLGVGDIELGSQLHEMFQELLSTLIPMLLEEANAAASFLMLWKEADDEDVPKQLTEEGRHLIEVLVSGMHDDLFPLVDLTHKGAHLMCLPMLATVGQWFEKISSDPLSWVLVKCLTSIQERLKKTFDDFMQKKVAEIDRYDMKRSVKANGVKAIHVLPFVSNFAVLVHRIELLLTEVEDSRTLEMSTSLSPSHLSGDLSDAEPELERQGSVESAVGVGVSGPVRKEVDLAYMRLVVGMFRSIESLANSDEKHGDRLRLENYSYFEKSVGPLARHVAVLEKYCKEAIPLTNEAMQKYVQQQLEYGRLWGILAFSNKIEAKLQEMSPQEIAFQTGFSSQDVRNLISQTMANTDKKLSMMYARVKKHLGESAPKLLYTVWQSVEAEVLDRYRKLEEQMAHCYPNIQLTPSPEELAELFKTTGPGT